MRINGREINMLYFADIANPNNMPETIGFSMCIKEIHHIKRQIGNISNCPCQ